MWRSRPKAIKQFKNFGIKAFVGAKGTVTETIDLFKPCQLAMATDENACNEHRHRIILLNCNN